MSSGLWGSMCTAWVLAPQHLEMDLIWGRFSIGMEENLPAMQESPVQFLGREDPLEKG